MNMKDKTRDKLMSSMRRTKESASAQGQQKTTTSQPKASKPASKPAAKKSAAPATSGNYSSRLASATVGFESGGRVWPD